MPRSERSIQRIRAREAKVALYAILDENNVVFHTYEISRQDMLDADGNESEFLGKVWWKENYGPNSCISTPPNAKIIRCLFGVNWYSREPEEGHIYDEDNDVFLREENPFPGVWIFDMGTMKWAPPVKKPKDGKEYDWNSELYKWVEIT